MTITVGDRLPDATFLQRVDGEIGPVDLATLTKGKKTVLFGLPGAFTGTCTTAHVPSFIRTAEAFRAKGVDHIVCFAVNDPWVMEAWGEDTGGTEAGITFVADAGSEFTRALGLDYDAPVVGFYGRCKRMAMYVADGVVKVLNIEEKRGVCELTAGETLLEQI